MSYREPRRADPRLSAIAGRWTTSGHVTGDPPVPVLGTDVYEVLAGGTWEPWMNIEFSLNE